MTIIAGFQCHDGILICSDTEEYVSQEAKTQVRKVPHFRLRDMHVAIGGSGDSYLIDFITQDLVKELAKLPSLDWNSFEPWLNDYANKTFERHIKCYAGLPSSFIPDVAFLIAVAGGDHARLFKWERNFAYALPLMTHASIGAGTIQSQQLLSEIPFSYPAQWMVFFAVRMMQKVKQLVQGCGGKTEILFLNKTGDFVVEYGVFSVDEIEHVTLMVDEYITNEILTFVSNPYDLSNENLERIFANNRKALSALREKYRNLVPELIHHVKNSDT